MSGSAQTNPPTSKLQPSSDSSSDTKQSQATKPAAAQLDEDDEFEDFPAEGTTPQNTLSQTTQLKPC